MGLRGPVWGTAFVLYCAHKNSGALSTAKGHGVRSSRGGPTLTVPFLQSVSSRWLKAAGVHQGQNRGWTLPAAPWGGLEGGLGCGGSPGAWRHFGQSILPSCWETLTCSWCPSCWGGASMHPSPPACPLASDPPRLGNKDASWCVSPGYWSGGRTGSCRVPRGSAASGSLRW